MKFDRLVESILKEAVDPSFIAMVEDYIDNDYILDQGYGEDKANAEQEQPILAAKIKKIKGQKWFDKLEELAGLETYSDEYAGPNESEKILMQITTIRRQLGLPPRSHMHGM